MNTLAPNMTHQTHTYTFSVKVLIEASAGLFTLPSKHQRIHSSFSFFFRVLPFIYIYSFHQVFEHSTEQNKHFTIF